MTLYIGNAITYCISVYNQATGKDSLILMHVLPTKSGKGLVTLANIFNVPVSVLCNLLVLRPLLPMLVVLVLLSVDPSIHNLGL